MLILHDCANLIFFSRVLLSYYMFIPTITCNWVGFVNTAYHENSPSLLRSWYHAISGRVHKRRSSTTKCSGQISHCAETVAKREVFKIGV